MKAAEQNITIEWQGYIGLVKEHGDKDKLYTLCVWSSWDLLPSAGLLEPATKYKLTKQQ